MSFSWSFMSPCLIYNVLCSMLALLVKPAGNVITYSIGVELMKCLHYDLYNGVIPWKDEGLYRLSLVRHK